MYISVQAVSVTSWRKQIVYATHGAGSFVKVTMLSGKRVKRLSRGCKPCQFGGNLDGDFLCRIYVDIYKNMCEHNCLRRWKSSCPGILYIHYKSQVWVIYICGMCTISILLKYVINLRRCSVRLSSEKLELVDYFQ